MTLNAEIRLYILQEDGRLDEDSLSPFDYYGTCPNVGDTIWKSWGGKRKTCYSVQRRYFIDNHDFKQGWVVILREVEMSSPIRDVWKAWEADEKFWAKIDQQERDAEQQEREDDVERAKRVLAAKRCLIEPPLDPRERKVMASLAEGGIAAAFAPSEVPALGPKTKKMLLERGFIRFMPSGKSRGEEKVKVTKKGLNAWRRQLDYHERYRADR